MRKIKVAMKLMLLTLVLCYLGNMSDVQASPETTYEGVDYEAVFNADYYAAVNADVAAVFGQNKDLMFQHFILYGMQEGRVASAEFNVAEYITYNPDLVAILGTESVAPYYVHYVLNGKAEGRIGSSLILLVQQEQEQKVYETIMGLKTAYPEGMYWTNAIVYQFNGANYIGYGCAAFAFLASDAAFGYAPVYEHYDYTKIRVGDILRINNDTHSVIVTEVHEDYIVIAEGNYNKSIHWGRTISNTELEKCLDYVWSRY